MGRGHPSEAHGEYDFAGTTSVKGHVMNIARSYRSWRRYRETVTELSRLSNRELSDVGLTRGDIPFIARKGV
jgi:uncharacterized protein YjiS (DUF1127 family)